MKKFVAAIASAAILATGGVALEGATVATHAAVAQPSPAGYGGQEAKVQKVIDKLNQLVKAGNLTPKKAVRIIEKLKDARDAGVIGKTKYKQLKKKIKRAL